MKKYMLLMILILSSILLILSCEMNPLDGESGIDGTSGTDGTDGGSGADGEDGQDGVDGKDLLYTVYDVYDNSGDYVGESYRGAFPYPLIGIHIISPNGYIVYHYAHMSLTDYYPSVGFPIYKDAEGKVYSVNIYVNKEMATNFTIGQWYKWNLSATPLLDSEVVVVEYAYVGSTEWTAWDDSTHDEGTLVELTSIPFSDLGLPIFDPPFTLILQE